MSHQSMEMGGARILMPSIADPAVPSFGAASFTRSLLELLSSPPLSSAVQCIPLRTKSPFAHRLRQVQSVINSQISRRPSKHLFTRSPELLKRIRRSLQESRPDLCILNGSDLVWLLDILPPDLPVVLVAHNLEHRLYQSQLRALRGIAGVLGPLLRRDCAWLEHYEMEAMKRISNVVFLSSDDHEVARTYNPKLNALIFPPVFGYPPAPRPRESSGGKLEVGFTGYMRWGPNRDGLEWFLRDVFPRVKHHVRLHLFGIGAESFSNPPEVIGHGFQADPAHVWGKCHLMINPVFRGGGVSIKVAEAIYNRVPVLVSPFSRRGLRIPEHPAIAIREGADEWVTYLRSATAESLLREPGLDEIAASFSMQRHRAPVHDYFHRILALRPSR